MTQITYNLSDDEFSILCQGHAGYADAGNDIVCAAISTLTQTLVKHMEIAADEYQAHADKGELFCNARGVVAVECFKLVLTGLRMLQANYPRYLKIVEGCTIFTDNDLK